jgi:hypothetical protein
MPIAEEPAIVWIDGIGIVYSAGPTIISGPKKAGKTTFIRLLLAAILSGDEVFGITAKNGLKIAIYDTEQIDWRILSYLDKSFQMAGKRREINDRLTVFQLRPAPLDQRLQIIEDTIMENRPDIAVVDGLADLVIDINSMADSQMIVDSLLRVADESGTALILILHTNPSTPDGKSRGNLGTIAENKAECNILVSKSGDIFTVTCKDARGRAFPSFSYAKTDGDDIIPIVTPIPEKPLSAKEKVLDTLEPGKTYTASEVASLLGNTFREATIRGVLSELFKEGRATCPSRGCYVIKGTDENLLL